MHACAAYHTQRLRVLQLTQTDGISAPSCRTFRDSVPVPVESRCGEYIIERSWTVQHLINPTLVPVGNPVTQVQKITVQDLTAPVFQNPIASVVRVPFFESRVTEAQRQGGALIVPVVQKTSTAYVNHTVEHRAPFSKCMHGPKIS